MPSKDLPCEFCQAVFRKDALPAHIRSKHTKDVGQLLLRQYKESNYSVLQSFAMGHHPKVLNVWSELYPDACYFFGVKPQMFFDDDSWGSYIKAEENMRQHQQFIEQCLDTISIREFLEIEKEITCRAPEVMAIKADNRRLEKEIKDANEEKAKAERQAEYWKQITEEYKDTLDAKETFKQVERDRNSLQSQLADMEKNIEVWRKRFDEKEFEFEGRIESVVARFRSQHRELEEMNDALRKDNLDVKKKMEKVENKIKTEAGKMMEKELKRMRQEKAKRMGERLARQVDDEDLDSD